MRHALVVMLALAATAVAGALAFQAAARERDYRLLLAGGDAAIAQDQSFGAIENYSGAIALRPDSMLAHLRRGQTYRQRGNLGAAARDFRTAASLDPSAARPLEELADVLYGQQRFRAAAEMYEARLRLDERNADITFRLALARFRNGNFDGALSALGQTIRLDPGRADALYLTGMCLREKKDIDGAVTAFEAAIKRSPGLIPAREELADLYAATGRPDEELEQVQLIAGLDRDHIVRQISVAIAHAWASRAARDPTRKERQANLAILTLGSVLERAPDHPAAYRALGDVWLDLARSRHEPDDLSKAVEALERAAVVPGAPSATLAQYGRALLLNNNAEAAERALQQATTRLPVDEAAFLDYAAAAERRNHLEAARTALIQYSALVPPDRTFPGRALRIGQLSLRVNDPATAVAWLTQAESLMPDDVRVFIALGTAHLRLGNTSAARAVVNRGLKLAPAHAQLTALAKALP